jgi:hypothetical protein
MKVISVEKLFVLAEIKNGSAFPVDFHLAAVGALTLHTGVRNRI